MSRQVILRRRPEGAIRDEDVELVNTPLGPLAPDRVRVRNLLMSVDPYMRVRMDDVPGYETWDLGAPLQGAALGIVEESRVPHVPMGAVVSHRAGWRDVADLGPDAVRIVPRHDDLPLGAHLGMLGMTGLTAFVGLTRIAHLREGETVFVSGAAGAVGGAVGQMARIMGAGRVIGSAGGPDKAAFVRDQLGFDECLDYRAGSLSEQLGRIAPEGIDVYFDNVGGDHLQAALDHLVPHGRVAVCGSIADYDAIRQVPGPTNLIFILIKRLVVQGFTVHEHHDVYEEFVETASGWIREGRLDPTQTVVVGLENALDALRGVLTGANRGKMLVHLGDL